MKIWIVTKNTHKVEEATSVFKEFEIKIEQIPEEKYESKDMGLKEVAGYNAKKFYEKYKKPVIVDDTGVFFSAYPDFPGNHPKLIFDMLGYKGLLKLLENENRNVEFRTAVAYCDGKHLKLFTGKLYCVADTKINDLNKDVLPYERILLVNGRPISSFSRDEKNKISHRAIAFRKVGEYLKKNPRDTHKVHSK